jgi:hypothetical protein
MWIVLREVISTIQVIKRVVNPHLYMGMSVLIILFPSSGLSQALASQNFGSVSTRVHSSLAVA